MIIKQEGQVPYLEPALSLIKNLSLKYFESLLYLQRHTLWLISTTSGIECITCFKNIPIHTTIPENITAANAKVNIVIIIISNLLNFIIRYSLIRVQS